MKYDEIDPLIIPFMNRHGLHIMKSYQDTPVRYILIVDDKGNIYEINIEIKNEQILLQAYDQKTHKNKNTINSSIENINEKLEESYKIIESWISQNGTKRTPV